jgi:hypothetical protein
MVLKAAHGVRPLNKGVTMLFSLKKAGLAALILVLAGCASAPKTVYSWDNYQPVIYQYYQGDKSSPEEQIAKLQEAQEKAKASAKPVPPGLHAQLGLLYATTGKPELAFQQFTAEKTLFPESAAYMDFLMTKNKGSMK